MKRKRKPKKTSAQKRHAKRAARERKAAQDFHQHNVKFLEECKEIEDDYAKRHAKGNS